MPRAMLFSLVWVLTWGDMEERWIRYTAFPTYSNCWDAALVTRQQGFKVYGCRDVGTQKQK